MNVTFYKTADTDLARKLLRHLDATSEIPISFDSDGPMTIFKCQPSSAYRLKSHAEGFAACHEMGGWVNANERKPHPFTTVVVWVRGGPIHFDNDYADVGCFNRAGEGLISHEGHDVVVPISHWMPLHHPPEVRAEQPQELQAALPKGFVDNDHDGMG